MSNNTNNKIFIPYYISKSKRINKLVLSGGSTKGIAYIGIIKGLEEYNIINNIKTFCGTSIGAIFSFILNIGFTYNEMTKIVLDLDISKLCEIKTFNDYGFDDGMKIINFIKSLMDKKKIKYDITFKELFDLTNKKLIICACNLTLKKSEYFNYKNNPNMKILTALRMSFSIPILFCPIKYNECYYIDGGLMNNLPYNIFKNQNKVLCININNDINIDCLENYLYSIIDLISSNKIDIKNKNIINLNLNINISNFNIDNEKKIFMINYGYINFFNWINLI